jgi:hypothetical protein
LTNPKANSDESAGRGNAPDVLITDIAKAVASSLVIGWCLRTED